MRPVACLVALVLSGVVSACAEPTGGGPTGDGACGPGSRSVDISLAALGTASIGADSSSCVRLSPASGRYLLAPILGAAGPRLDVETFSFGDLHGGAVAQEHEAGTRETMAVAARQLDALLRRREAAPAMTASVGPAVRALRRTPALGDLESFTVLGRIVEPAVYRPVTGRAVFVGARIAVFVDTAAAAAFPPETWASLGVVMDQTLAPLAIDAFGAPTDVDGNGRVLVLFSPVVNSMVTTLECARSGFVRGFFNPEDLAPTGRGNGGEVFYALVPDPTGRYSCAHALDEVRRWTAPVFIHELQHMISYGEHVLRRNGPAEAAWLNEGLSHVAEELGGLAYAARYPAPQQRSRPGQWLPDSAEAYIHPNLANAYDWLGQPMFASPVAYDAGSFGSLVERGATWLLLRWVLDHAPPGATRSLVETRDTGLVNLARVTGRSADALLADFALVPFADSLPGLSRGSTPARLRLADVPLRRRFADLLAAQPAIGSGFPVRATLVQGRRSYGMRPMTWQYFVAEPSSQPARLVQFATGERLPWPAARRPRLAVMRLPD